MFGVQFHPEVTHSLHGLEILRNFSVNVCGSACDWNMADIAEEFIRDVSTQCHIQLLACHVPELL